MCLGAPCIPNHRQEPFAQISPTANFSKISLKRAIPEEMKVSVSRHVTVMSVRCEAGGTEASDHPLHRGETEARRCRCSRYRMTRVWRLVLTLASDGSSLCRYESPRPRVDRGPSGGPDPMVSHTPLSLMLMTNSRRRSGTRPSTLASQHPGTTPVSE